MVGELVAFMEDLERMQQEFVYYEGEGVEEFEDQHLLFGSSLALREIGVCPELSECIAEELLHEAVNHMDQRKARAERASAVKSPGAKQGPKGQ